MSQFQTVEQLMSSIADKDAEIQRLKDVFTALQARVEIIFGSGMSRQDTYSEVSEEIMCAAGNLQPSSPFE